MTEPETCSEVYSDIEKSLQESENGSHRRSQSDNNTDTSQNLNAVCFSLNFLSLFFFLS